MEFGLPEIQNFLKVEQNVSSEVVNINEIPSECLLHFLNGNENI